MTISKPCPVCGNETLGMTEFCSASCASTYHNMVRPSPKIAKILDEKLKAFRFPLYTKDPPKGQHFEAKMRDDIVYTLNDDAMKIGIQPGAGDFAMTDWKEPDPYRSILGGTPAEITSMKKRSGYIPLSDTEVNDAVRRFLPHVLTAAEKEIDRLRTKVCHLELEIFTLKVELDHCRRAHQG